MGPSWAILGPSSGRLWAPLAPQCVRLDLGGLGRNALLAIFFHLDPIFGPSSAISAHLRRSWADLGPSWAVLGPSWAILGPSWRRLGAVLGPIGPSWGRLGPVLGPSWVVLGPSWGCLGAILGRLGPSWVVLGPTSAGTPKSMNFGSPAPPHFGTQNGPQNIGFSLQKTRFSEQTGFQKINQKN